MEQDEDARGEWNNHLKPHLGLNQPEVAQVLIAHRSCSHKIVLKSWIYNAMIPNKTPFQWKSKTSLSQCSIGQLVPINQSIFYPGIQGIVFLRLFCAQLHNTTRHPSGPLMVPYCQGKPLPLNSIEFTLSRPVQKKVDLKIRLLHGAGGVDYFSQWSSKMELNVSSPTILPLNVGSETDMYFIYCVAGIGHFVLLGQKQKILYFRESRN